MYKLNLRPVLNKKNVDTMVSKKLCDSGILN